MPSVTHKTIPVYQLNSTFQPTSIEVSARDSVQKGKEIEGDDEEIPSEIFCPLLAVQMVDGQTCPPPLLHEADLIALMEKHGIGALRVVSGSTVIHCGSECFWYDLLSPQGRMLLMPNTLRPSRAGCTLECNLMAPLSLENLGLAWSKVRNFHIHEF